MVPLVLGGTALGAPAAPSPVALRPWTLEAVQAELSLADATIQRPVFQVDELDVLRTEIELDGETWTLVLSKHSLRADDFQLLVQLVDNGPYERIEPAPPRTYKGMVLERPEARVRGSFFEGQFTGIVLTDDEEYGIEPLVALGFDARNGEHVVYRGSDWMNLHGYRCGVDEHTPRGQFEVEAPMLEEGGVAGTGLKIADVSVEADFEFFQKNGSNVNTTLADMENVINNVEAKYEVVTIGITLEITTAAVDAVSPSDYTSPDAGTRLCEFRTRGNTSPQTQIRRDLSHLFTGRVLNAPTLGVAWLGTVCGVSGNDCGSTANLGYGLVESRFTGASFTERVALSAHEMGHNWDAQHCDGCGGCASCCRIMCSGLGSCTGILTSFGCFEESQIVAFKNTRACLLDLADPQVLPFSDDFPSGTLSTLKWSYNNGGAINTNASNEPSGTMSMNLDAAGNGTYQDDDLRTNYINLTGEPTATLSYWTQHVGVENGEQFVVEYFGTNNLWNELNRITSNGVDQANFVFHSHAIPANGLFNEFRVRFRPEVNESNDEWYLDDVSLTSNAPAVVVDHPNTQSVCQGAIVGFDVTASGTPPITYQWKKNGMNIPGATANSFVIGSAQTTDAGNYTCVATNGLGSDESDPATLTVFTNASCNNGLFCDGTETCVSGACVSGGSPCAQACKESNDTCQPFGTMTCQLTSSGATVGGTAHVDLFLKQVLDLHGYQAKIDIVRTSGAGTVSIDCPAGINVDLARTDFVFAGQGAFTAVDCPAGRLTGAIFSSVEVPNLNKYLGEYDLVVSGDATLGSTFEISIVPEAEDTTFLRDLNQVPIPFTIGAPCVLTIVNCANYGDVAQPLNGLVNIDDIICVLNGFSNFSLCPLGDLAPCFGNGVIDLNDILAILSAFAGNDPCCGG